ncbi:uncharacterized protein N7469_000556 [Penicillium citrinum]|uniref:Uncharacterized protein n=1 Tax=Penicillium citrinum TaxID=5077 RepID=A0A9W9TVH6_PENCI|nr:uncharacterized protein N7469_000556 [Penicillium citrinum]KAJ5242229.1 hypothetical protein N7469_000556 [Penicillium citrinum]
MTLPARGKPGSLEDVFLRENNGPTIAERTSLCTEFFEKYMALSNLIPDPTLIDDQLARFTLWASNMDVFGPAHVSLDYRLRYSPTVVEIIHQLLQVICNSLKSRQWLQYRPPGKVFIGLIGNLRIVQPLDDPPQTPIGKKRRLSGSGNAEVTKRVDDSSDTDSDEDQVQKNVKLVTFTIGETVTRLFRLSNAIRKSAKESRINKIRDYTEDEEANNAVKELRLYTECYIRFRFPQAPDALRSALVDANALRLKRLYYQRSHRRRIALSVQLPQTAPRSIQLPKVSESVSAVHFTGSLETKATDKTPKQCELPSAPKTYATTARQTAVQALIADSIVEAPPG